MRRHLIACWCVLALALGGCGQDRSGMETPTVGGAPATPTSSDAPSPVVSPTAASTEGSQMDVRVVDFQVWQDYMPAVPPSGPPLHVALTLEVDSAASISRSGRVGSITLQRASGEEIVTADLETTQRVDDMGLVRPGGSQVILTMPPQPVKTQLTEGETIKGMARIEIDGQEVSVPLPETPLMFTH